MVKKSTLLLLSILIFAISIASCSAKPLAYAQPTPTLSEPLSQRDAIRHMRSHVIQQVQIVDPFQVTVTQSEGAGDVFVISYLSPHPFASDAFEAELKNVVLQATEGFTRAEPRLPYLVITSTSVDQQSGSRTISIEFDTAYQWFTGQIDTESYSAKWVVVQ
jgi:hypothetical protein